MSSVRPPALLISSFVCLTLGCADPSGQDDEAASPQLDEEGAAATAEPKADPNPVAADAQLAEAPSVTPVAPSCPTWYRDCDGDGYAASDEGAVVACEAPSVAPGCAAFTQRAPESGAIDCDDQSAAHHPGATYGLAIDGSREGLQVLLCRPDGTYAGGTADRRCVVTEEADLDCDGALDPDPAGGPFCLTSGQCIGTVSHACADDDDCNCVEGTLACGIVEATARLCGDAPGAPSYAFTGTVATLCR